MPSRVRRRALALVVVALLGLVLAHVALAGDPAGLSPRGPESPQAAKIEGIYWLLIAITGGIFVLVEGALILFVFRFRNRGRSRTLEGPEIHGATRLELIWTGIPIVILAAIVAFVLVKLPGINSADSARAAGPPLVVKVEGRQFYWNFVYPNGVIQVERMRVPAHRDIKLVINSEDVDHSWWIPALQGKFDAIPGKTNHLWFRADRTGTFEGQCGEFCGYEHPAPQSALALAKAASLGRERGRPLAWCSRPRRAAASLEGTLWRLTSRPIPPRRSSRAAATPAGLRRSTTSGSGSCTSSRAWS